MAIEIERKFLVKTGLGLQDAISAAIKVEVIHQGYFESLSGTRVRVVNDERAVITIKKEVTSIENREWEYPVPYVDGMDMLKASRFTLHKIRYYVPVNTHLWEVDVFQGKLHGLVVAEIELTHEEEAFVRPNWIDEEVTYNSKYKNTYLAVHGKPV